MLYMFDFDGTIADSRGIGRKSIIDMLIKYNIQFDEEDVLNKRFNSFEEMIGYFNSTYFSNKSFDWFCDEYNESAVKYYVLLKPKDDFFNYLNSIDDKAIIVTRNTKRKITEWTKVNNLNIDVITESELNLRKDDEGFYSKISDLYNVSINDMILFEDDMNNIITANKCGVKVIGVTNGQSEEDLKEIVNNTSMVIDDYNCMLKNK